MNFQEILNLLDEKVKSNEMPSLVQQFQNTTYEDQVKGVLNFFEQNKNAWVSDTKMELEKCIEPRLSIGNRFIDLRHYFEYLSPMEQKQFWIMLSIFVDRNPTLIHQKRQFELEQALQHFCKDLSQVDVNMTIQEALNFVESNREAIETRLMAKLNYNIQLAECDQELFWLHMEKIYNLKNPFDKIVYESNPSFSLVKNLIDKTSTITSTPDGQIDFASLFTTILDPTMMQGFQQLFTSPGGIGQLLQTLEKIIPR